MDASVVTRNPPVKNVNSLQLEEALHEFANYDPDRDWAELIYLPPDLLEQISVDKLPVGVPIGIGNSRDGYVETYWEGFFVRYDDQSFTAVVQHQISPRYWPEAIGARSWLDLLYRSVQSRLGTVPDLQIGEYDDSEEVEIRFEYSFSIGAKRP